MDTQSSTFTSNAAFFDSAEGRFGGSESHFIDPYHADLSVFLNEGFKRHSGICRASLLTYRKIKHGLFMLYKYINGRGVFVSRHIAQTTKFADKNRVVLNYLGNDHMPVFMFKARRFTGAVFSQTVCICRHNIVFGD